MAFSKGDKVRINASTDEYEVVWGPDAHRNYCIQNASGVIHVRSALDLSPLPRTLAEVEPGVAVTRVGGGTLLFYRDHRNYVYCKCLSHVKDALAYPELNTGYKAHEVEISEVLGPVKTVIEGRE